MDGNLLPLNIKKSLNTSDFSPKILPDINPQLTTVPFSASLSFPNQSNIPLQLKSAGTKSIFESLPAKSFLETEKTITLPSQLSDIQNNQTVEEQIKKTKEALKVILKQKSAMDDIINCITESINKDNFEIAKSICQSDKLANSQTFTYIPNIIKVIDENTAAFAKRLFLTPNLITSSNIKYIPNILKIYSKYEELASWLSDCPEFLKEKNIPYFTPIIYALSKNETFGKLLLTIPQLKKEENIRYIAGIINVTNNAKQGIAEKICANPAFCTDENICLISDLLGSIDNVNIDTVEDLLENKDIMKPEHIRSVFHIVSALTSSNINFAKEVINNKDIPLQYKSSIIELFDKFDDFNINPVELCKKFDYYKNFILNNLDMFVNGEINSQESIEEELNSFFREKQTQLFTLYSIYNKDEVIYLFRKRMDSCKKYLNELGRFTSEKLDILKKIISSNSIDDKPLLPKQKIETIDLISSYFKNHLDPFLILDNISDNKIDLNKARFMLFKNILKNIFQSCGFSEENINSVPNEKLVSWDLSFMHLLSKTVKTDLDVFKDLFLAANSEDFEKYILYDNNVYSAANKKTESLFLEKNMDYEAWLHPDKTLEAVFTSNDKDFELLSQTATEIIDVIEELRSTPIGNFFDKKYSQYLQKGNFVLPKENCTSRRKLSKFINNLISNLEPVWERAELNKNNPALRDRAQYTLSIRSELLEKIKVLENLKGVEQNQNIDVTIKMWDRIPQKDLFQGNYSTCCIGMGDTYADMMPHYLLNTAFNMIELVDNNTGKTIGNALCYFVNSSAIETLAVTDEGNFIEFKDKPVFVIDNIEINNAKKPDKDIGIELRKKIFEYASAVAKSVTGMDTQVCMSSSYNDVALDGLKRTSEYMNLIGDVDCDRIYLDLFGGRVRKNIKEQVILYK